MSRTPTVDALLLERSDLVRCHVCEGHQTIERGDRETEMTCWECGGDGVVLADSDSLEIGRAA